MKSPSFAVIFLVTMTTPALTDCTIVAQDDIDIYFHELAHCNGWQHPFGAQVATPSSFIRRYPGTLKIIITPGSYTTPGLIARFAQPGAQVTHDRRSSETICRSFWLAQGLTVPTLEGQTTVGCAIQ